MGLAADLLGHNRCQQRLAAMHYLAAVADNERRELPDKS